MVRSRGKSKGRRDSRPFLSLPLDMLNHPRFAALSAHAVKLLIDIARNYNGRNNGDLSAAFSMLQRERHWKSRDTLGRAVGELCRAGFLQRTAKGRKWGVGGVPQPNLYAITWRRIDHSDKHDCETTMAPRSWLTQVQNSGTPAGLVSPKTSTPIVVDRGVTPPSAQRDSGGFASTAGQVASTPVVHLSRNLPMGFDHDYVLQRFLETA